MNKLILCTTKDQLIDHYLIRKAVFIDEQKVSYEDEFDLLEKEALPFLFVHQNKNVGAARIKIENEIAKFERICILKPYRGKGLGMLLIQAMIKYSKEHGSQIFMLGAQAQAVSFYEKCGFKVVGPLYYDAKIPHYPMKRESKEDPQS